MYFDPIVTEIRGKPLIIYPESWMCTLFDADDPHSIEDYYKEICARNRPKISYSLFQISIMTQERNGLFVDIWSFYSKHDTFPDGIHSVQDTYIDMKQHPPFHPVISSVPEAKLILALEEEHRKKCRTLDEYVNGPRPDLPEDLQIGNFYPDPNWKPRGQIISVPF